MNTIEASRCAVFTSSRIYRLSKTRGENTVSAILKQCYRHSYAFSKVNISGIKDNTFFDPF
jgi:hypothetical protein